MKQEDKGRLFVVSTPLGNLEDITFRAVKVLKEVELVAAEDTRRTRKLLSSLGAGVRLISCNEHNELKRLGLVLELLEAGKDIALVSDAGTPGISDPGARLVRGVRDAGLEVIPVPGPSAVACALSVCGMRAESYYFGGFLPSSEKERKRLLQGLSGLSCLLVFFETPHRVVASLKDMIEVLGDRQAFLAREMTKVHETYVSGSLSLILERLRVFEQVKGEITLVVEGKKVSRGTKGVTKEMAQLLDALLSERKIGVKEASMLMAQAFNMKKGVIYKAALEILEGGEEP